MKFSVSDIKELGTILSIWAHPDDESFCAGALLAAAVQNGQRVAVITATRGDAGKTADESRWPQQRLGEIREQELQRSLQILGINEHYWLNYADGQLENVNQGEAAAKIAATLQQIKPDTIISFGADGITGHPDHQAVYRWTKLATTQTKSEADFFTCAGLTRLYDSDACRRCQQKFNLFFATDKPLTISDDEADLLFDVPEDLQALKMKSIEAHECQMSAILSDSDGKAYIDSLCCCEGFMREAV